MYTHKYTDFAAKYTCIALFGHTHKYTENTHTHPSQRALALSGARGRAVSSPKSKTGKTRLTRLWTQPWTPDLATAGPARLNLSPADPILRLVKPGLPGCGHSPVLEWMPWN